MHAAANGPYYDLSDIAGVSRRVVNREWFLKKVEQTPTCWLWKGTRSGTTNRIQYGQVLIANVEGGGRHFTNAHRVAYELWKGPIPQGLHVCHTCDNGLCVNPDHLFVGTWRDNCLDKVRKGRQPKPDMSQRPNFTRALITPRAAKRILALRATGMTVKEIVQRVFYSSVRGTVSGNGWKSLQPQTVNRQ